MLKIFTNQNYLTIQNKGKYFPLFDELITNKNSKLYEKYCFVNTIEECDILILPLFLDYLLEKKDKKIIDFFKENAKKIKKPLWVFTSGDFGLTVKEDFVYVFKLADFETEKSKKTIIIPPFIEDPYKTIYKTKISYLQKSEKPILGYVGHAKGGLFKFIKFLINYSLYNFKVAIKIKHSNYFRLYSSSHKRIKYLKIATRSKDIITNFIFRDKYRAGAKKSEDRKTTTLEFFDNIKTSNYTFCMRGFGNFSVRLYETLAMGRIPVQIDTNCSLPLRNFIDWEKHCIIVKENEIDKIGSKISEFNKNISQLEFINLQKSNRDFWEMYFTRVNYFAFIHDLFIQGKM